ncbi:MAG: Replication protein P [Pseudomonadaceae bacterium]|nr:Replication protein P [Pseudomonadaceae bacterium]
MGGTIPAASGGGGEPPTVDQRTAAVVNLLFAELQSIFPAHKQAWPTEAALAAAKKTWIKGFMAEGINSVAQLRHGIERCRASGSDFAPSIGKFIFWCRPTAESLGLPTEEKAFTEAVRKTHPAMAHATWSHDAVYHAAAECGFYNLQTLQQDASRKLFARNYSLAVRDLIDGKPLKARPPALTHGVEARVTPEVGRAGISALRQAMKAPRLTELPEHMAHLGGGL